MLCSLGLAGWLYAQGMRRLRQEGNWRRALGLARPLSFAAGMVALGIALLSPLDALAAQLFSAHMTQHLLLMLVAPPLLVWSRPVFVWLWAFPLERRRRIGRFWTHTRALHGAHAFLMRPTVAWLLASFALWFWHIPGPYNLALANEGVHTVEHLCFFLTSLAFWTLVLEPYGRRDTGPGTALVMVVTFALHNGLLGALLTFAKAPLYRSHVASAWGLTALEDQQLAGLIMWVPAGFVHLGTVVLLFAGWMSRQEAYGR